MPVVLRGTARWLRHAESPASVLTRAVLGTSAVWTTAPDALDALGRLSTGSVGYTGSVSTFLTLFGTLVTVGVLVAQTVVDASVPLSAIERVEVDEADRELTVVHERGGRWFDGTRERTLRPVSERSLATATAAFRRRGIDVERVAD